MSAVEWIELESCTSTNTEAWKIFDARPGDKSRPFIVHTNCQTAGRGRQGREWISSGGNFSNLTVSLFCPIPSGSALNLHQWIGWIPLCAGLAIYNTIQSETEFPQSSKNDLRLKWPNDLYLGRAKCGGILCESRMMGNQLHALVIGLGLNLFSAPTLDSIQTDCLLFRGEAQQAISPEASTPLKKKMALNWATVLCQFYEELTHAPQSATKEFRDQWLKAANLDRYPVIETHAQTSTAKKSYRILDLRLDGALKVQEGQSAFYLTNPI